MSLLHERRQSQTPTSAETLPALATGGQSNQALLDRLGLLGPRGGGQDEDLDGMLRDILGSDEHCGPENSEGHAKNETNAGTILDGGPPVLDQEEVPGSESAEGKAKNEMNTGTTPTGGVPGIGQESPGPTNSEGNANNETNAGTILNGGLPDLEGQTESAEAYNRAHTREVVRFDRATGGRYAKINGELDAQGVAAWQAERGLPADGKATEETARQAEAEAGTGSSETGGPAAGNGPALPLAGTAA